MIIDIEYYMLSKVTTHFYDETVLKKRMQKTVQFLDSYQPIIDKATTYSFYVWEAVTASWLRKWQMKAYPKQRVASTSFSGAPLALRQFLHTWFY